MVGYVNVHGEEDFSSEEASVGRVVGRVQLLFGQVLGSRRSNSRGKGIFTPYGWSAGFSRLTTSGLITARLAGASG